MQKLKERHNLTNIHVSFLLIIFLQANINYELFKGEKIFVLGFEHEHPLSTHSALNYL